MNQSEFLAFSCNLFEARQKSHAQGTIGFGFATHRMKNWRLKHLVLKAFVHLFDFPTNVWVALDYFYSGKGQGIRNLSIVGQQPLTRSSPLQDVRVLPPSTEKEYPICNSCKPRLYQVIGFI